MSESDLSARRPIKTRDTSFARGSARFLDSLGVSPNLVSVLSVVCALLASACIIAGDEQRDLSSWYWWLGAIVFIQCRLLCNLFDGMIAVEGGKATYNGDLFNEVPDRLSDVILFAAAGYACMDSNWGPGLGWFAAISSLLTAYIRLHGASLTGDHDFGGPMAKAQRMFSLCVVLAVLPFSSTWGADPLLFALGLIGASAFLTFCLRTLRLSNKLKTRQQQ